MADAKTRPAPIDLARHLAALPDPAQRRDCATLATLMQRVSGAPPVLWGSKIVGFGTYRYQYASGRGGDWPLIGFAPRGHELTVYMMDGFAQRAAQLAALGPHKTGKSCLYLKGLDRLDLRVLETMLAESVRAMRARYRTADAAGEAISPAPAAKTAARKAASKRTAAKKPTSKTGDASAVSRSPTKPGSRTASKTATKALTKKLSKLASGKTASSSRRSASRNVGQTSPAAGRKSTVTKTAARARTKPAARTATPRARKPVVKGAARRAR